MTAQIAFVFPGQGSQTVGMGADIYDAFPAARGVFATADQALGFALSDLCFQGPEERLRETVNAQPAIVTVSLALLAALQAALAGDAGHSSLTSPLTPAYSAGHSVGEYAALVAAGAIDLTDAIRLVRERGRLMHHEGTICPGGMAAVIGMDGDVLQDVCREATELTLNAAARGSATERPTHVGAGKVIVANFNAPGQIVISGENLALQRAVELAKERGAKRVIPLAVSGAFHSPVMQPAAEGLARMIATTAIRDARLPVVSNISATPLREAQAIRDELARQIATSVQWTRTIEYLVQVGVTAFIEIGPGQALTGMIKRIAKGVTTLNVSNQADISKAVATIREMHIVDEI
ncbi:MAG: ACP S-malonyltransferase [Ktedonobacteraceae bacterium]